MGYDPKLDHTAGGALAQAIVHAIAAVAATKNGAPIEAVHQAQGNLAHLLNEYVIDRIAR